MLWVSPDIHWSANFIEGMSRPSKLGGTMVAAVVRRSDETPVREWATSQGITVERVALLPELLTSVLERFVPEQSALIAGVIGNIFFLGLFKDGECIFEHSLEDGPTEFEKALKACLRQTRGAVHGYLISDSSETKAQLQSILQKATGSAPKILAQESDAGELLAASVAPAMQATRSRFSVVAAVAGAIVLSAALFGDYTVRNRVDELESQRAELHARKSALMTKAVAFERELDGQPEPAPRSEISNVDDTIELLAFLSRVLPREVSLEEVTAVEAAGGGSGYAGIKASAASKPPTTARFLIRGSARNLSSFSHILQGFERSEWRIQKVEEVQENRSDTTPLGYGFRLAVERS